MGFDDSRELIRLHLRKQDMQFKETYKCLSNQINYHGTNMKYSTWMRKQSDLKAAFLFVNFYSAVQSAWYRKKQFEFIDEAEAVSLCLQYLQKNVKKIEKDKNRYTPSYIYTVCVNCMSILHWRKCDKLRYNSECSSVVVRLGKEFDVLSIVPDVREEDYNKPEFEYQCCNLVEFVSLNLGVKYEKLLYSLINDKMTVRKVNKSNVNYDINPLAEVSIGVHDLPYMKKVLRCVAEYYILKYRPDLLSYIK